MNLDTMAYGIDKRLPKVFPRRIKRADLGPIHNVFAKDENEIQMERQNWVLRAI